MSFIETNLQFDREFAAILATGDLRASIRDLPKGIQKAIRDSDIKDLGGNYSWLGDARIISALHLAHEAHHGKARKWGSDSRLIHEIWCAHQVYNFVPAQLDLEQRGLDPKLGAFCAVIHDIVENERDWAEAQGHIFDAKAIISKIEKIWGNAEEFNIIRTECIEYMTDAANTPKKDRIATQRAKGMDAYGKCNLTVLQQCLRMFDKLHHVVTDAAYCVTERNAGRDVSAAATKQLGQARDKSFPFIDFSVANSVRPKYYQAVEIIKLSSSPRSLNNIWGDFFRNSLIFAGNVGLQMRKSSCHIPRLLGYSAS